MISARRIPRRQAVPPARYPRRGHRRRVGRGHGGHPLGAGERRPPLDLDMRPRVDRGVIGSRPMVLGRSRPPRPLVVAPLEQDVGASSVELGFGVLRRAGRGGEVGEVGLGCRVCGSGSGSEPEGLVVFVGFDAGGLSEAIWAYSLISVVDQIRTIKN